MFHYFQIGFSYMFFNFAWTQVIPASDGFQYYALNVCVYYSHRKRKTFGTTTYTY